MFIFHQVFIFQAAVNLLSAHLYHSLDYWNGLSCCNSCISHWTSTLLAVVYFHMDKSSLSYCLCYCCFRFAEPSALHVVDVSKYLRITWLLNQWIAKRIKEGTNELKYLVPREMRGREAESSGVTSLFLYVWYMNMLPCTGCSCVLRSIHRLGRNTRISPQLWCFRKNTGLRDVLSSSFSLKGSLFPHL